MRVGLLNLMPDKLETERDWVGLLNCTGWDYQLLRLKLHTRSPSRFPDNWGRYIFWNEADFDLLIVTGAPVERLPFNEVTFWDEFGVLHWQQAGKPTLWSCWSAMAAYSLYGGLSVEQYDSKLFGMYDTPLGLQPVSRWAGIAEINNPAQGIGSDLFWLNHPEYPVSRLADEYFRDKNNGADIGWPAGYGVLMKNTWTQPAADQLTLWYRNSQNHLS